MKMTVPTRTGSLQLLIVLWLIFIMPDVFADSSTSGGLKVSDNGRFLVRDNGSPFFWLGDSAQTLLYRLSREDTDFYLQHRADLGFTVIETQIISFLGINATNHYGHAPFTNGDPFQPNQAFWQHVDYVINKAASLGLTIALVPDRTLIVNNSDYRDGKWGHGPFNHSRARDYGQYVGRRYTGKSIVWMLGWDIHPSGREVIYSALADGIAQGAAGGDHNGVLISFQPSPALVNLWNYGSSSRWFHPQPWLDFNSLQSGHTDDNESYGLPEVHALITTDYDLSPIKPVIDLEPSYENTPDGIWNGKKGLRMGAPVMRRKAYWAVFAGAAGHTYGHNDIVAFHEPGRPDYSGQEHYWKDMLNAPGASQMRHLRTLIESRPQLIRVPDQSILASDPATGLSHVRATRASDGSYAFIYIPDGRSIQIKMNKISGKGVQATWFDPRNGTFSSIGRFAKAGVQTFEPPGKPQLGNDWALVLDGEHAAQ